MKKLLLPLLMITSFFVAAQSVDKKWGIGLSAGLSQYTGDYGNDFLNFSSHNLNNNAIGALDVSRYLTKSFDVTFHGSYGSLSYYQDNTTLFKSKEFTNLGVHARYKFANSYIIEENSVIRPYAFVGLSADKHAGKNTNEGWNPTINVGAGVNYMLSDNVALFYQLNYGYMFNDSRDKLEKGTTNDSWFIHQIGININVGPQKDTDGDKVSDKKDKCPNTPPGVTVDEMGCPVDSDKDGISDYLDKCPTIAGNSTAGGCPDADKDGVADAEDQCVNEPGLANLKGCPDTDGDGIIDSKDNCPTVKGLLEFNGCPDTDGDGIEDGKDDCPKQAGNKWLQGCPDTDGDRVADQKDRCPTVAGDSTNGGCPVVKAAVTQLFQKALQGIQFETGKSTIKKTSNGILDQVVKVMIENPSYNLVIEGHTDDVGNDDANMKLSQARADAVAKYMANKGVDAKRLKSVGYGETKPVLPNTTKANRDKNRRVELKVEFEELVP